MDIKIAVPQWDGNFAATGVQGVTHSMMPTQS